jgi:transposase InsO family protein
MACLKMDKPAPFSERGREWAYAAPYQTSDERAMAMIPFIDAYNTERPHSALAFQTPGKD